MVLLITPVGLANFGIEAGISSGVTDNLLSDSTAASDTYTTTNAAINYYPLSMVELQLHSDYTYYSDLFGLSNFSGGGRVAVIPTGEDSPISVYLSSGYSLRLHRDDFEQFDNNNFDATASLEYRLQETVRLRAGAIFRGTAYVRDDAGDKESLDFFGGINASFLGRNSFDLEFGYGTASLSFIDAGRTSFIPLLSPQDSLVDGHLNFLYVSPRYSRPIGSRSGFNITLNGRFLSKIDDIVVFGFSTGYLSPWASIWDGIAVSLNFKTFLLPGFTTTAGVGYWDKEYLKTIELSENGYLNPLFKDEITTREDEQVRVYFGFQRPFVTKSGMVFEPNLRVEYANNVSTAPLYDYHDLRVTFGLTFRR